MTVTAPQLAQRRANVAAIAERRRNASPATRCKYGHELTAANTYTKPSDGRRECLTCKLDREWYRYRGIGRVTG